jgi:hypothetical protein
MGALTAGQAQALVVNVPGLPYVGHGFGGTYTFAGGLYNVTTFTGSYNDNSSKFETAANGGFMPWWHHPDIAVQFATAVKSSLGLQSLVGGLSERYGPLFAWSSGQTYAEYPLWDKGFPYGQSTVWNELGITLINGVVTDGGAVGTNNPPSSQACYLLCNNPSYAKYYVWAQAEAVEANAPAPVPGPLPALGAIATLGFSRKLRNRIKGTTNAGSSTDSL